VHRNRDANVEAFTAAAREPAGAEAGDGQGGGQGGGQQDERTARKRAHAWLLERGWELGRRTGGDEEVVHAVQALALGRRHVLADELAEVRAAHPSSPSRRSASRPRPLRVRVFTVPSGTFRKSATSLCDMPPQ
jgi:hypothetical protein